MTEFQLLPNRYTCAIGHSFGELIEIRAHSYEDDFMHKRFNSHEKKYRLAKKMMAPIPDCAFANQGWLKSLSTLRSFSESMDFFCAGGTDAPSAQGHKLGIEYGMNEEEVLGRAPVL